jgi:hypothetical protein
MMPLTKENTQISSYLLPRHPLPLRHDSIEENIYQTIRYFFISLKSYLRNTPKDGTSHDKENTPLRQIINSEKSKSP